MRHQLLRGATLSVWLTLMLAVAACGTAAPPSATTNTPSALATNATQPTSPPTLPPTSTTTGPTAAPTAPAQNPAPSFNFDRDPIGGLPGGAAVFSGTWAVRAESDAPSPPNALCQTGAATYPALSLTSAAYADVTVMTRFKPIAGNQDRAAGIIFRIQNKDNYYILRANALEDNVNFYKYVAAQRIVIKEGSGKVASGQWHELKVEAAGNRLRGSLDGTLVVETTDDTYKSGGVGLWTKADSVTCFDDVRVTAAGASSAITPARAATVSPTPAGSTQLRTESFQFVTIVSEDETVPLVEAIRNLPGVTDVQAGAQELQVTYDPTQVNRQQISALAEAHGIHVKP
ncbi:MAG: hypothetical protein HYR71_10735 [Chloroflexi bacterium]|nr:hypothetical protein [Chloroflexota bacterium]